MVQNRRFHGFTVLQISQSFFDIFKIFFLYCIQHIILHISQAFNRFYDFWFGRNRAKNFKNRAFFLHFLEIWLNLIFSKNVIYAFRPSRKTLKVIKNIRRSWRIRFQLLKRQNRPPNDEKKTKFPNKMSEILDFTETVSRYRRYLAHFSIFFKSVFCIAFYTF